ncbi:MAG: nitrophenyl compound nitroreductase subunit ArsF family protein [Marinifilaceae bacterium]|jgi:uncharacterized transporter YbjL|nr:nitrophenyl compound nitroreductase subunit ArsF family protein [Marinifilaceae bacterium]
MKKFLSTICIITVIGLLSVSAQCCSSCSSSKTETTTKLSSAKNKIEVYYFHATRRCATCKAVESVSAETIKNLKDKQIVFKSINRETERNNPLIKKFKISGQTLIIVGKSKSVNLTNFAFMNARTKPEKLKAKIQKTIKTLL